MEVLSTKISDLYLKDGDARHKEPLVDTVPIARRKVFENLLNPTRERNEAQLCDVVLLCGPKQHKVFAHRDVLASKVPNLISMIEPNNNEAIVVLPEVEEKAAEALINFVYTSELQLSTENVWDVVAAAEVLQITEILNSCREYMTKNILAGSWLYARQIALEHDSKWLLTTVDDYIFENFTALLQSTDFLELRRLQVEIINKKDLEDFRYESESSNEILRLVVDWCKVKLEVEPLITLTGVFPRFFGFPAE